MKTKVRKIDTIYVSAPGKIILHGEHAVVYGKRALAASLNRRAYLKLEETNDGKVCVELPDIGKQASWSVDDIKAAFDFPLCDIKQPKEPSPSVRKALFKFCGLKEEEATSSDLGLVAFLYLFCGLSSNEGHLSGIHVHVHSQLPPSAGLGSSAAYVTCLSAALLLRSGEIPQPELLPGQNDAATWKEAEYLTLINSWAFQAEKVIHGQPSGIDNSISTYGGGICYQSGNITPMPKVPAIEILLTDTNVPRSTKVLVAGVRQRYDQHKKVIAPILDSIEALTDECEQVLKEIDGSPNNEQVSRLEELISINQCLLGAIGVSHEAIEDICLITRRHGFTSKLTGAGGGGCVFTLLSNGTSEADIEKLKSELTSKGYMTWRTLFGGNGVTLHLNMTSLDV